MESLCGCLRERLVNSGARPPEGHSGTALLPSTACGKQICAAGPADPSCWPRNGSTRSPSVAAAVGLRRQEARSRRGWVRSPAPGQPAVPLGGSSVGSPWGPSPPAGGSSPAAPSPPAPSAASSSAEMSQSCRPWTKPSGSSKSSSVGSRSGCAHTASRPVMPLTSVSWRQMRAASRSLRGRSPAAA
jgi:hypothetical protein